MRRLAAGPPLALAASKKAVNAATLPHLDAALERERTGQTVLLRTSDVAEGMRAFAAEAGSRCSAGSEAAPFACNARLSVLVARCAGHRQR